MLPDFIASTNAHLLVSKEGGRFRRLAVFLYDLSLFISSAPPVFPQAPTDVATLSAGMRPPRAPSEASGGHWRDRQTGIQVGAKGGQRLVSRRGPQGAVGAGVRDRKWQ